MKVILIPCLKDNYCYVAQINAGKSVLNILVDAPDFHAIDDYFTQNNLQIDFILSTHHHGDHVDGNSKLKNKYNCKIYGSGEDADRIPGIDFKLKPEEIFKIGNTVIETHYVPGHTHHHIVYYIPEGPALFSGDTLFSMGCGRLFEGTYAEMYKSLQKIKTLPNETKIYCGHEYSEKNAQFALSVDGDNTPLKKRYQEVLKLRSENRPTVPTTLALEKEINPFLRASSVDEFKKLRQLRDNF